MDAAGNFIRLVAIAVHPQTPGKMISRKRPA
jgi:hypothetical protein